MARAPKSFTVKSWEESSGEFGVCVDEPARTRDDVDMLIMEIEMSPDELIELASDILILALRKQKEEKLVSKDEASPDEVNVVPISKTHDTRCPFWGQPLLVSDACGCSAFIMTFADEAIHGRGGETYTQKATRLFHEGMDIRDIALILKTNDSVVRWCIQ